MPFNDWIIYTGFQAAYGLLWPVWLVLGLLRLSALTRCLAFDPKPDNPAVGQLVQLHAQLGAKLRRTARRRGSPPT